MFPILSFCLISLTQANPLTHKESSINKLDVYFQKALKEKQFIGCAVALVKDGKVVFMKAYGVKKLGGKDKVNDTTLFQLASLSKPITATLVAILKKKGKVDLQHRLKPYFPFLHKDTRLYHLLSHTTGYSRQGWAQRIESPRTTKENLIASLKKELQSEPGKTYDYHNFVYGLVEDYLAWKVRAKFSGLLKENLFKPLGMKRTTLGYQGFIMDKNRVNSHCHRKKHKKITFFPCSTSRHYHSKAIPAGGINASIRDLVPFLKLQMQGDEKVLSYKDLVYMHTPQIVTCDIRPVLQKLLPTTAAHFYALGWRVIHIPKKPSIIYHGGTLRGVTNFLGFIPEKKIGIIILNNSDTSFAVRTGMQFLMGKL